MIVQPLRLKAKIAGDKSEWHIKPMALVTPPLLPRDTILLIRNS